MNRLVEERGAHRLTQAQAARLIGVSASQLCRWERETRTPNQETQAKLARAYGAPLAYLFPWAAESHHKEDTS